LSLRDAIQLATVNPARVTNIVGRQNGLMEGDRADVIVFRFEEETKKIAIEETYIDGRRYFAAAA